MSRDSVLARGQAKAEAGMVDACTIRRVLDASTTTDQITGVRTKTYLNPNPYSGKCRVQATLARSMPHEAGEDFVLLLRLQLQLPVSVTGLMVGDEVTITAVVHDQDLTGRVYLIRDLMHKSEPTARRIDITERTDS